MSRIVDAPFEDGFASAIYSMRDVKRQLGFPFLTTGKARVKGGSLAGPSVWVWPRETRL